jgi:hypothetical protein
MPLTYSKAQHHAYLDFMENNGRHWVAVFDGNTEFYSAAYWDLLKGLWRADAAVRKTDALSFMTAVKSAHTAGKYVDATLAHGYLVETENPDDARSKLISLSPDMRAKLDAFFDTVVDDMLTTAETVRAAGR